MRKGSKGKPEKKFAGFSLPISLLRKLKIHVAENGGTQSALVEEAIKEKLEIDRVL